MAKAYSLDLRRKVFAAWQTGEASQAAVAARFAVSESFVRDLSARQRQSGDVAARPRGGGRKTLASPATLEHLHLRGVAAHHDHTIAEHHQSMVAAGHAMSAATVGRLLLALRLTRKKRRSATTRPTANG